MGRNRFLLTKTKRFSEEERTAHFFPLGEGANYSVLMKGGRCRIALNRVYICKSTNKQTKSLVSIRPGEGTGCYLEQAEPGATYCRNVACKNVQIPSACGRWN